MNEKTNKNSFIKYIAFIIIILLTPTLAIKMAKNSKSDNKGDSDSVTAAQVENIVKNYLDNHPEQLLNLITSSYYSRNQQGNNSEQINNAIMLYEKILFDEKLPKIISKEENAMKITLFFSDFDLVLPILEEINSFPNSLKTSFFFRQITTQNKLSAIISCYSYAVYKINPSLYIPFYLSILQISKKDLTQELIYKKLIALDLNPEEVKLIADNPETEKIILESNRVASQLGINQLPAFVFENGRVLFSNSGFGVVKQLMYEKNS